MPIELWKWNFTDKLPIQYPRAKCFICSLLKKTYFSALFFSTWCSCWLHENFKSKDFHTDFIPHWIIIKRSNSFKNYFILPFCNGDETTVVGEKFQWSCQQTKWFKSPQTNMHCKLVPKQHYQRNVNSYFCLGCHDRRVTQENSCLS